MKVIVGLGNPGREYAGTRHNVGWWVVDHLADVWRFDGWKKDNDALVANGTVGGAKVRLVKPQTYMNNSGEAVRHFLKRPFWAVSNDLLVISDEVALPVGRYRFRGKGSAGGHNGLKDLIAKLGEDFWRLRLGIGHPGSRDLVTQFVLSRASSAEQPLLDDGTRAGADVVPLVFELGAQAAMQKLHTKDSKEKA